MGTGTYAGRRDEAIAEWRTYLADLARCPNAYVKIGGISSPKAGFGLHDRAKPAGSEELAGHWRPYVETCIELFGRSRGMFESNFPVDKQLVTYVSLWNAFKRIARQYSAAERQSPFADTAMEFYGFKIPAVC
jgi:L-fuconolactonase